MCDKVKLGNCDTCSGWKDGAFCIVHKKSTNADENCDEWYVDDPEETED